MNDLRFAFRQLFKNPGFTAVAVLTLAICIGANLSIFAVVDAVLVRSLPLPDADRLVVIHNAYPASGVERGEATITDYFERRGFTTRRSRGGCKRGPSWAGSLTVRQIRSRPKSLGRTRSPRLTNPRTVPVF
jgi:hypothetical protein